MERRNFILKSTILTATAGFIPSIIGQSMVLPSTNAIQPVLLPPQPPLEHNNGMVIKTWIRSSMTNGVYSNVECAVGPKLMGPPPHYHKELDELMFVLEGTASILLGDDIVEVQAGGWQLRPRMLKHTFWNASDKPLRFFDMYLNQPFEEYLEEIFYKLTAENGYPDGSDAKIKRINELNEKFGVIFENDAFDQRNEIAGKYGLK